MQNQKVRSISPFPKEEIEKYYDNYQSREETKRPWRDTYFWEGSQNENCQAGFIRKVYTLLSAQLLATALFCVWARNSSLFFITFVNYPTLLTLTVALITFSWTIGCFYRQMKNYGLPIMVSFTLLFSLFVAVISTFYQPQTVAVAAGVTWVLVCSLTAYACLTKNDFTTVGPYLFCCSVALVLFGILLFFWREQVVHLVYSCLVGLLFSVYLIFDTQLVLGRGTYSYGLEDAYFASIQLYVDVVEIFLQILNLLNRSKR